MCRDLSPLVKCRGSCLGSGEKARKFWGYIDRLQIWILTVAVLIKLPNCPLPSIGGDYGTSFIGS